MNETIGKRIEQLIKKLGITKTAFSEKLKVSQPYISKLIADKGNPSERLIDDICEKFSVNREWLLIGQGGENNIFLKPPKNDLIAKAASLLGEQDPVFEAFVETYSKLNPSNRKIFINLGLDFLESLKKYTV